MTPKKLLKIVGVFVLVLLVILGLTKIAPKLENSEQLLGISVAIGLVYIVIMGKLFIRHYNPKSRAASTTTQNM